MTMLVSWIGVDTHGPSSVYIAADSRISWTQEHKFDFGKKVFASKNILKFLDMQVMFFFHLLY